VCSWYYTITIAGSAAESSFRRVPDFPVGALRGVSAICQVDTWLRLVRGGGRAY